MTDEERSVLEKLGFRLEDGAVKHLKLGIVERCEVFEGFASLAELEAFAKAMLRTRCPMKTRVTLHTPMPPSTTITNPIRLK